MKALARHAGLLGVLAVTTGCEIGRDSGFDAWCGDELCSWTREEGEIRKAKTWHAKDYGVELVGEPVVLSQKLDAHGSLCLSLRVVGDVDRNAGLTAEFDEKEPSPAAVSIPIPELDWEGRTIDVEVPDTLHVRVLRLRKDGPGDATLAVVQVIEACHEEAAEN